MFTENIEGVIIFSISNNIGYSIVFKTYLGRKPTYLLKVTGDRKAREEEIIEPFKDKFSSPLPFVTLIPKIKYFCTLL